MSKINIAIIILLWITVLVLIVSLVMNFMSQEKKALKWYKIMKNVLTSLDVVLLLSMIIITTIELAV